MSPVDVGWFYIVQVVFGVGICLCKAFVVHPVQCPSWDLHLVSAPCRCCNSVLSSFGIEQTAFALCVSLMMTLYFVAI